MKLPYPTITYDKYWHQIVVGWGIYQISRHDTGCKRWSRLFGIGKPYNEEYEKRKKEEESNVHILLENMHPILVSHKRELLEKYVERRIHGIETYPGYEIEKKRHYKDVFESWSIDYNDGVTGSHRDWCIKGPYYITD